MQLLANGATAHELTSFFEATAYETETLLARPRHRDEARGRSGRYRRDMVQSPRTSCPAGSFGVQTTVPPTVCVGLAGMSAAKRQAASANSSNPPAMRTVRNGCWLIP